MTDEQIEKLTNLRDSGLLARDVRDALDACIEAFQEAATANLRTGLKLFRVYTTRDEFYVSAETRPVAYQKVRQYARSRGATSVYLESCDEIADSNERTVSPKFLW